jgi:tetratricopeptide (TPR) repeat protein
MPPLLCTLGQLRLSDSDFRREKPLLLLAYLCLSGPQARRSVAQQFWPGAASSMNSLSVALAQLRRVDPDLISASETQVRCDLECDVSAFRTALRGADLDTATRLYNGPFLLDLSLSDLSEELEEWVMTTRESLADGYRSLLLSAAQAQADTDPRAAAELAARAWALAGATPLSPSGMRELYALLLAADHPQAAQVRQEAGELGLSLSAPVPGGAPLLGRRRERERLGKVAAGETVWLRGAAGMGKSALLRAVSESEVLSGRSGQAFLTLLPLAGLRPPASAQDWLDLLRERTTPLLVDDWEAADPESRRVLLALSHSHAGPPLIISSRERSPLGAGSGVTELVLHPLTPEVVGAELHAQTAGLPALIHAVQHGESVSEAVGALLASLTPRARQLLACLAVQERPDNRVSGAALELGSEDMAEALESLSASGWLRGSEVAPRSALLAWLAGQPSLEAEVLSLLAPHLAAAEAWPLYLRAHALTGSSELPGFQAALSAEALKLLSSEQASEAEALLSRHANTPETRLLHARALHALGRSPEALKLLDGLEGKPVVAAVRARVLFRLGRVDEAKTAAQDALKGDLNARAQGYDMLGILSLAAREYEQAKKSFLKACGLFQLLGDTDGYLNALCTQAVAMTELGEDMVAVMAEILELGAKSGQPKMLTNIGWLLERQDDAPQALTFYQRSASRAQELGLAIEAALAWNNVGVIWQKIGEPHEATQAYQAAIAQARQSGEVQTLALVLGNLAELQESVPLLDEAIELLQGAGQDDLVAYFETQRESFRGRSGGT